MRSQRSAKSGLAAPWHVLGATLLAAAVVPGAPAQAAWTPADAADLAAHCGSPSWSEYMLCQQFLVERAREMPACAANLNGARLQLGYVRYAGAREAFGETAAGAEARRYLEQSGDCG